MPIRTYFPKGTDGNIVLNQLVAWPVDDKKDQRKWNEFVRKHHRAI